MNFEAKSEPSLVATTANSTVLSENERIWRENLNTGDDIDALKVDSDCKF